MFLIKSINELVVFLISMVTALYFLWSAMKGKRQELRKLGALDAISDGVDRAVEQGKPVYVSPGDRGELSGMETPQTIAGMNIVRHTATLAIRKGARIIFPVPTNPETMPLLDGIFREVAVTAGKPEAYKREDVMFYGSSGEVYGIGLTATMAREGVACFVAVGSYGGSSSGPPTGWAREFGGISIAGTARWSHTSTVAVLSDYPLFMDDVFAAGAIASDNDEAKSSLVGGDIVKLLIAALLLISGILAIAGIPIVAWLKG